VFLIDFLSILSTDGEVFIAREYSTTKLRNVEDIAIAFSVQRSVCYALVLYVKTTESESIKTRNILRCVEAKIMVKYQ